jgi:hypothetical protein
MARQLVWLEHLQRQPTDLKGRLRYRNAVSACLGRAIRPMSAQQLMLNGVRHAKVQTSDLMLAVIKATFMKRYDIKLQIIPAFNGQSRIGGIHEQYDDSTSKQRP